MGGDEFFDSGTKVLEIFGDFLNTGFGSARAGAYADSGDVFEPRGINVIYAVDKIGGDIFGTRRFGKTGRVGGIFGTDDENEIGLFGERANGCLAIGGRVSNVFAGGRHDVRKFFRECANDRVRFGEAQGGLGEVGEFFV